MIGPHAYGSDTRNRLRTLSYLAIAALFITLGGLSVIRWLFEFPALQPFKPYSWPISPITMTAAFVGVYLVYDLFLWKKLSRVPNIAGTWIGVVLPNYQPTWPHLEIISIEQTWSEILIHGDVYFRTEKTDSWSLEKKLGTYDSTAAGLTDVTAERAKVSLSYNHQGIRHGQPDFQGSMSLGYTQLNEELFGKYYTNRMDKATQKEGSLGIVILRRVSSKIVSDEEALALGQQDEMLKTLERQILNAAT